MKAPLSTFKVPIRHFDHINIDLVGPLPPSQGYTYLFTIVDCFTHWPEAIPLSDTSASTCARALVSHWISRFGLPGAISSDRGAQFTFKLWTTVSVTWNEEHQDHLISSTGQWISGMFPSAPEICITSTSHRSKLDRRATMGSSWNSYCT